MSSTTSRRSSTSKESESCLAIDKVSLLTAVIKKKKEESPWYCHCCTALNEITRNKCKVCGRPDSYAQNYPLPFHGENAKIYRPSQILNVLDDIHVVDSERWTSLHSASAKGNLSIVKCLIENKSPVNALTNKGHTALHLAVYCGSIECVQELLLHGANVNLASFHEQTTALHMACELGHARIAQLLLQSRADVNAINIMGRAPLHCVAISGRVDIALLLLRGGAKLKLQDIHGWTAEQISELYNHQELTELFIREGMTDKQAVMKDLPPAPWHSSVWTDVVQSHATMRNNYDIDIRAQQQHDLYLNEIKTKAKAEMIDKRRAERQIELAHARKQAAYMKALYSTDNLFLKNS